MITHAIHANHLPAELMLNVDNPKVKPSAPVYPTTLVFHPIVDPSALKAQSACPVWPASINDARIPVLAPVPTTPYAMSVITCPVVSAQWAMWVIRSPTVTLNLSHHVRI